MVDEQHELMFGDVDLVSANPSTVGYEVNTLAELDFGNPEPVVAPIQSLLLNGSLAEVLSYDNRNIVIRVEISGPSLVDVSAGEEALMAEVRKGRNTLTWLPADSFASPIVFDVIWSRFDYTYDDLDEALRQKRTFVITLNCAPFGRDDEETEVQAVATGESPPAPVTDTVDACTSAAGWQLTSFPSAGAVGFNSVVGPTATDGGVRGTLNAYDSGNSNPRPDLWVSLTRTGLSADMTATPYLLVTVRRYFTRFPFLRYEFRVNGSLVQPLAASGLVFYLDLTGIVTVTSLEVRAVHAYRHGGDALGYMTLSVDDITRTNVAPFIGTRRMQFRKFVVGGSAPTEASLQLAHESSSLGDVRIYTMPARNSGYQPPLRQYRTDGATPTPDTNTASGGRSMLNGGTPETYDVPAHSLIAGTHLLEAILRGTIGPKAVNYSISTLVGDTEHGVVSGIALFALQSTDWQIVPLASLPLPPVALPAGSTAKVRIELSSPTAVEIDDAFIYNTDEGRLTGVICGTESPTTGGSSSRVWVDAPRLDWPNPAIWLGTLADRSDARHAIAGGPAEGGEVPAQGTHIFEPGEVNLFTLSTKAPDVAASLRYFRRYQHNRTD
ncbi:hypothetical protein LRP67_16215 [Nocardioides sp. cx-169]|uniref:hypothetical protein n=1 Tax=Nocardioides sp. cx-169 TaxID=2899080 RepID=UPI001E3E8ECA|nr:hypothetical protein [Nocardioides sp. cx-169]MCD4535638.1 hypothetical protein [Nocardioides sp. cx-169]